MKRNPYWKVPPNIWEPILLGIGKAHGIPVDVIKGRNKTQAVYIARAKFWMALREHPSGYGWSAIAAITGHNHASVFNACTNSPTPYKILRPKIIRRKQRSLIGLTFGFLTVVSATARPAGLLGRCKYWLCKCSCGQEHTVPTGNLVGGNTNACGKNGHRFRLRLPTERIPPNKRISTERVSP